MNAETILVGNGITIGKKAILERAVAAAKKLVSDMPSGNEGPATAVAMSQDDLRDAFKQDRILCNWGVPGQQILLLCT